jgi:hypothetical protein
MSHAAPEAATEPKGQALAIIALIVGVVSLLLCWIPIVNNVVFFLGVLGLILGLWAWSRARKGKSGGRGLALAAWIISLLSIAGVFATQAFYGAMLDSIGDAVSDGADGNTAKDDSDKEAEKEAKPLALGEAAKVGDEYVVIVESVNLDAADVIKQANQFNEDPKGRYVLVSLATKYVGSEEGDPWVDLGVTFAGGDSRNYDESSCEAVVPNEASDQPTLTKNGKASYDVCFDVPDKAIAGGKLYVSESMSFNEDRKYWSLK